MGAVTGVHRAGASLNVHVHFHLLCVDGVYVADADETLRFEPAPAPTRAELTSMLERIYARVMKWLARRGLLRNPDDAGASNAPPELSPAEALATAAMLQDVACRQRREYPHPVVLRGVRDRHPLERGVRAPHRDDHGDLPGFGGGADARSAPSYSRVSGRARPRPRRLLVMDLISGEAASVDAPSLDMEGQEVQLLAFVLSTRDVSVVAAGRRLRKFPALDLSERRPARTAARAPQRPRTR